MAKARPAVEADVDGIVGVRRAAYTTLQGRYPSPADFEGHLDEMSRGVLTQGSLVLVVGDEHDEIVGTVTVIGDYIRMLAVKPSHQGQGLPRELLRTAIEHGGRYLNTAPWMTEARQLYPTLGYQMDASKTIRDGSWELLWYAVEG
ncbi:MAG TPA: GNAT family N-acetyltransferase [Acidimicrobiales bacterium]|nr:GNAT family N-acetyltransferase [Acidimicrobiales bacterium]